MIQEYLFVNGENRVQVEQYRPDKVNVHIYDIDNTGCWIATYSVAGENEDSANLLCRVNKHILNKYNPTVLANGSSAYYNKMLYPVINGFERKLRKLLYLKSAVNRSEKSAENIRDLESKDLGEIFTLLFTDEQFVKGVKASVNSKTWQFTKQEIKKAIEALVENTTWDNLIGSFSVPALRDNFLRAKDYRNDVMHAHDIDTKVFREAKRLFEQINDQLDAETRKIIDIAENRPAADHPDFNENLSTILERSRQNSDILQGFSIVGNSISDRQLPVSISDIYGKTFADGLGRIEMRDDYIVQLRNMESELQSLSATVEDLAIKLDLPEIDSPIARTSLPTTVEALSLDPGIRDTLLSADIQIDASSDPRILVKK